MISLSALVLMRAITGFAELVSAHGGDHVALMKKAGVAGDLSDPEAIIPLAAMCRLLALAADELELRDFGLQLAAHQDLAVLGSIALIALNAETVEQAILATGRNMPYHSPALHSELISDAQSGTVRVSHDIRLTGEQKRHLAELSLLNAVNILRSIAQLPSKNWTVRFEHPQGFDLARYQAIFGCDVLFDQPNDEFNFPAQVLDAPVQAANPALREVAERYVRSIIRRHPLDLARQIEELLIRQLGSGRCTLSMIARQLGVAERSLQRRLEEQNIRFEQIIDDLRRQRATELLALKALPMTRIAECLGYSSQTTFTRSCRRWFGEAPQALRQRLHGAGADEAVS